MITDKQSLLLCGILAGGMFAAGVLDILSNFIVLTVLTIIFLTIIINLFFFKSTVEDTEQKEESE